MQNSSTIVREVEGVADDVLLSVLTSPYLDEGVFGFEFVSNEDYAETLLFSPAFYREDVGAEVYRDFSYYKDSLDDLHCYRIMLTKPSFLPLYTKEPFSLFQNLSLLHSGSTEIFAQFLFTKRSDHWQTGLINQYESYLQGNDYPSKSKMGRKFQKGLLDVLDKMSGFESRRSKKEAIEQKILDHGFRFEIRLAIHTKNIAPIEAEIGELLKEKDFLNELCLIKTKGKKEFVQSVIERRFTDTSLEQMISEAELITLVGGEVRVNENQPKTILEAQEQIKQDVINSPIHSRYRLLPIGEKKEREVDHNIVADLPAALKKSRTIKDQEIKVHDVELGATVQRITIEIPKGVVFTDIKNKQADIQAVLGPELSVIQGNIPNTVTFLIPCSQREIIYLRELLENQDFIAFAKDNPLPFVCGIDMFNNPVFKCLTKAPHLLVAGATNSGKSVFINALLITLILLKNPQELRILLIDPKKVEFMQYEGLAHVEDVIIDMEEAVGTLEALVEEMEQRYDRFAAVGVKKIDAYNNKSKKKMPYIVCAIDEYNDLKMQYPRVEEHIERLGQKARASGIHLIVATQRPDKDVMSGVIKSNLPSRIAFKLDNTNEYKTVFGTGIPYRNLLGFGDGVVKYVGQVDEFIRFQAPVIHLNEVIEEETYENIRDFYDGETIEGIDLHIEPKEAPEEPIDKLKRIIMETGETRVKQLREEMGIRINDVSDMLQRLVDEGFLEKDNRGYTIKNPPKEQIH